MALQRPPPPQQQKKSGLGCFGCGCVIVLVIFFLALGLVGGVAYFSYGIIIKSLSDGPAEIPAFNGSEDIYTGALKKLDAFNQDVGNAKASTLTLSADEINSLFAHNKDLATRQVRVLVSLNGDEARLQGTIPTKSYVGDFFKDKYLNFDATFAVTFNSDTKIVNLDLHKVEFNDSPVSEDKLPTLQAELMPLFNAQLQSVPACKYALQAAKTVTVKDSQLVIETK